MTSAEKVKSNAIERLTLSDRAPYHRVEIMRADYADVRGCVIDEIMRAEILIVGLGSIGRRHLANLQTLGWTRIRVFRTGHATLASADLASVPRDDDLATALARKPLAVIVSNPTALHMPVALAAARAGAHLLIEKPLSHDFEHVSELQDLIAACELNVLIGFQFRFNPGLRQIKAWIEDGAIGSVISAQVHWGEYLPGMHPWENYRVGYAARPELGGGVLLTLCHPFDYLRWLLGEIVHVSANESRDDSLRLDVDTCVDVSLRFASGATGQVHLDFLQQPREHRLTIVGTHSTLTWKDDDHAAHRYSTTSRRWEIVAAPDGFERNTMFLDEMRHFLACLRGDERPVCGLDEGIRALQVALEAKRAIAGALM